MTINPAVETARYIDSLGAGALEKAARYTHGDHWLLLWGIVVTAIATWIIVRLGVLERVSVKLEKRGWALRTWIVCVTYFVISTLIALPWTLYEEYFREKSYGRTSQPFADYMGQGLLSAGISALIGGLFFLGIYALIRRAGGRWWLWSGGLAAFAVAAAMLLSPLLIEPLFNDYKPVPEGPVRSALVAMAEEAKIPSDRIFMFDGSRQSNNFTANAGGVFGSARIAISDIALKGASLDEVKAVTGHEIGHYVLGHTWRMVGLFTVLAIIFFFLADRMFARVARLFGSKAGIGDPEGLPVLLFIVSLFGLFAEPAINAFVRQGESEADAYSLRTVNLPDALSTALVKTAEYRYPRPSDLEEAVFYDHPSVERRVRTAMEWKAAHPAKQ
jgi:STE24 endopeptidase